MRCPGLLDFFRRGNEKPFPPANFAGDFVLDSELWKEADSGIPRHVNQWMHHPSGRRRNDDGNRGALGYSLSLQFGTRWQWMATDVN